MNKHHLNSSDRIKFPRHNKIDLFNKNNENSYNLNYSNPTLINPPTENNQITHNIKIINQSYNGYNGEQLSSNQIKSQFNSNYNINLEESHYKKSFNHNDNFDLMQQKVSNSSVNNYSFNIQNNLNINNDRESFNNNNWNLEKNKINISGCLASKLSTDTFKVLDNFDDYLNQYEDINKISNKASKSRNNENANHNINNFRNSNTNQYDFNNGFNREQENRFKQNISKNFFVLDQEKKKGLILLNDSKKNLYNLNHNQQSIIDLTNENNDVELKLTNDNLEEILINCKDEQIQRELLINRTLKKKQKQNSFI